MKNFILIKVIKLIEFVFVNREERMIRKQKQMFKSFTLEINIKVL